jgi:hypothetical protein
LQIASEASTRCILRSKVAQRMPLGLSISCDNQVEMSLLAQSRNVSQVG